MLLLEVCLLEMEAWGEAWEEEESTTAADTLQKSLEEADRETRQSLVEAQDAPIGE